MSEAVIELPPKLVDVFAGEADYRGAWGGRGGGKTASFALMAAVRGYQLSREGKRGVIVCAREYMSSLADSSFAEVKAAIKRTPWLDAWYECGNNYIRTNDGRIEFAFSGMSQHLDSVKSKYHIWVLWVDEAESMTQIAWEKADNTVREDGAETWVTWNPELKGSPTDIRFRRNPSARSKVVEINWRDNPWFSELSERKRLHDKETNPEQYEHIWEGAYREVQSGAYYAKELLALKREGRRGELIVDPLMSLRAYWDIGGTGQRADACSIWVEQTIGQRVNVLNYYEARGQGLAAHVNWLRGNGYKSAECVLPHDGKKHDAVYDVTYESELRRAEFAVRTIPNQGPGAALARIQALRRLFPRVWMDPKCDPGREALAWYHPKIDEHRRIDLGPDHDWSSHAADAAGLMAVDVLTDRHSTGWVKAPAPKLAIV